VRGLTDLIDKCTAKGLSRSYIIEVCVYALSREGKLGRFKGGNRFPSAESGREEVRAFLLRRAKKKKAGVSITALLRDFRVKHPNFNEGAFKDEFYALAARNKLKLENIISSASALAMIRMAIARRQQKK
jgi:hypothetical protein